MIVRLRLWLFCLFLVISVCLESNTTFAQSPQQSVPMFTDGVITERASSSKGALSNTADAWNTAGVGSRESVTPDYADLVRRLNRAESEIRQLKQSSAVTSDGLTTNDALLQEQVPAPAEAGTFHHELHALEQRFEELKAGLTRTKYPTVEVHGVFQADTAWIHQDAASFATFGDIQDGADFRRARLSANGAITENMNYFLQMDFAFQGRPTFTDVWMEMTKLPWIGNLRIGQWKQPFSLEVVSSFRYTTFAERSLTFQSFTPFRHIAVGFYDWSEDERMTWAASVYRSGQDQYGGSIADNGGYSGVGRITGLPWYDEESEGCRYLHLGVAYNYTAPNNRLARFRTIPEYFVGEQAGATPVGTSGIAIPGPFNGLPFFVDTTTFGVNHYNLLGTELLWVEGPLSVQSEFMFNWVTRTNGVGAYFPGLYVTGAYFLTGEHRPYNRKLGAIDRIKVLRNLCSHDECGTGWGAWELAARYSYIDLNSKDIQGGRLNDLTLGLNWYWNSYAKLQFNYIRAFLDNPIVGASNTDIFGLRAQVDF